MVLYIMLSEWNVDKLSNLSQIGGRFLYPDMYKQKGGHRCPP